MQSVVPLYRMYEEGVFGRDAKFVPVLDGLKAPTYFHTLLAIMTNHTVRHPKIRHRKPHTWTMLASVAPFSKCVHCVHNGVHICTLCTECMEL